MDVSNLHQFGVACVIYASDFKDYLPPKKTTDRFTPSSETLITCMCYDATGNPWGSYMPHVRGSAFVVYPAGSPGWNRSWNSVKGAAQQLDALGDSNVRILLALHL